MHRHIGLLRLLRHKHSDSLLAVMISLCLQARFALLLRGRTAESSANSAEVTRLRRIILPQQISRVQNYSDFNCYIIVS